MEDLNVLDLIKEQQNQSTGDSLFSASKEQFPYLADKNLAFKYSPNSGRGFLEFYGPDEEGSPEYPRPKEIPMGQVGVEVFDPKTRPMDILADYVSHYGVEQDPFLKEQYQQFTGSFTPEQLQHLQEQYQYAQQHPDFKESRPYEQWAASSGIPAYFRGYTFDQWKDSESAYTPQQLDVLNQVRKYLGIK